MGSGKETLDKPLKLKWQLTLRQFGFKRHSNTFVLEVRHIRLWDRKIEKKKKKMQRTQIGLNPVRSDCMHSIIPYEWQKMTKLALVEEASSCKAIFMLMRYTITHGKKKTIHLVFLSPVACIEPDDFRIGPQNGGFKTFQLATHTTKVKIWSSVSLSINSGVMVVSLGTCGSNNYSAFISLIISLHEITSAHEWLREAAFPNESVQIV